MKTLSIDIETYSSADLSKCGVYRYVESPDFCVLLFAYSEDRSPVRVIDLAQGEQIPAHILKALSDPTVRKWAYNASFERVCLSRHLGMPTGSYLDPEGWFCSLTWAATAGLPLSLAQAGEALNLERQKIGEGRFLIKGFCQPDRTGQRVFPFEAAEKWEQFKQYNKRDVEAELEIQEKLRFLPVLPEVWTEYWIDQRINDRGVRVDIDLITGALELDTQLSRKLLSRLKQLTGLPNPASFSQLTKWLSDHGVVTESLGKKDVAALINKTGDPVVDEVLRLRQQSAKSSLKKYEAMQRAVCADNRCRGMFQFYGANRTGRWAGRLVQLQNLPQNHIEPLEGIRALVKNRDAESIEMLIGSVPDTLSQLIRTAFIAEEGRRFIVADFSAIEARVIAWLADEKWRMKTFAEGGDIYCASASQMFKVPVVKHGVNGHLRQKGKVAELACIAEGQLVLTDHGEIPIEQVTTADRVWDGQAWVNHEGLLFKGFREVITYEGLTATPDHLVFIEGQSEPVRFEQSAASGAHLLSAQNYGDAIRLGENNFTRKTLDSELEPLLGSDTVSELRSNPMDESNQSNPGQKQGLSALLTAKKDPEMAGQTTHSGQAKMHKSKGQRLQKLRGPRHKIRLQISAGSRAVSHQDLRTARAFQRNRSYRQQWRLCSRQYTFCHAFRKRSEQTRHCTDRMGSSVLALRLHHRDPQIITGIKQTGNYKGCPAGCTRKTQMLASNQAKVKVYDLRNAGPHHRYTVSGKIVHNCGYGGSIGALKAMGAGEMGLSDAEMKSIVDQWRAASPNIVKLWWKVDRAVRAAITEGQASYIAHGLTVTGSSSRLQIVLPSGRSLVYVSPKIVDDKITYMGNGQTKGWARLESYGPKFVENIVQGIARDLLCEAMKRLKGAPVVMHIHDELVIEAGAEYDLRTVCEVMGQTPAWAKGLLLRADGYETVFYKKD